jgi:two-component system LytT family response regulator
MQINCITVEDEPMALEKLNGFIKDTPFLSLQASFDNSLDALNYLTTNSTGLLFLDIQMDKLNGIQLLESLPDAPPAIITSAYDQYALKGYELKVLDYLLKPYSFERFLQAINKVREMTVKNESKQKKDKVPEIIFIRTAYQIERVVLSEILYVEGMKDYLGIVTTRKRIMCLQNFNAIFSILPEKDFVRVHKSYIVSLDNIESISRQRIKIGNKLIPVSDSYSKAFFTALKKYRRVL